jgi:hypothetical protein
MWSRNSNESLASSQGQAFELRIAAYNAGAAKADTWTAKRRIWSDHVGRDLRTLAQGQVNMIIMSEAIHHSDIPVPTGWMSALNGEFVILTGPGLQIIESELCQVFPNDPSCKKSWRMFQQVRQPTAVFPHSHVVMASLSGLGFLVWRCGWLGWLGTQALWAGVSIRCVGFCCMVHGDDGAICLRPLSSHKIEIGKGSMHANSNGTWASRS